MRLSTPLKVLAQIFWNHDVFARQSFAALLWIVETL